MEAAMATHDSTIPPIACNLLAENVVVELELTVSADPLGFVIVELVRIDDSLPTVQLVLARDPALALADRLAGAAMPKGLRS
jgi:hypothetical protein